MKLYNKFILILLMFTLVIITGLTIYFRGYLIKSYVDLENDFANKELYEIEKVINDKLENLAFMASDWGEWDDTYEFVLNVNEHYINSNLAGGAYLSSGSEFMLFLDKQNTIVHFAYYDEGAKESKITKKLLELCRRLRVNEGENQLRVMIEVEGLPYLIIKNRILKSDSKGDSPGYLVLGVPIDEKLIANFSDMVGTELSLSILDNVEEKYQIISEKEKLLIKLALKNELAHNYIVITGELDRDISEIGKRTTRKFIRIFLSVMILNILLTVYILRRSVLKNITGMIGEIRGIAQKIEHNERLKIEASDEFAELKNGINFMLSEIEKSGDQIFKSKERYKTLYEESAAIHLVLDDNSCFLDCNKAMTTFLNLKKEDVIGKSIYDFAKEDDIEWLTEYVENVFLGMDNEEIDITFTSSNGEDKTLHLYPNCLFLSEDNDEFSILITGSDVTERIEMTKKLEEMATFDPMTGCFNRRIGLQMLQKRIKHIKRYQNDLSICFIDVNGLKKVNDTFGHNEGDKLIKESSEVLRAVVRDSDIVVRLGGDEFLIVLPNCDQDQAEEVWDRVGEVLDELNEYKEDYKISMSHGIIQYNVEEDWTLDEYVELADKKMYEEKLRTKQARFI